MTVPLEREFAQLWEAIAMPFDCSEHEPTVAALSVIERHVRETGAASRCEKCGHDDVLIRWHEKRPTNRQAACRDSMSVLDYGRLPESHREHLHHHCRRCQYEWVGPVRAALPAQEGAEA